MTTATPRPWRVDKSKFATGMAGHDLVIRSEAPLNASTDVLAALNGTEEQARANGEHIALCVNLHDELVAVVEKLTSNPHVDLGDLVYTVREREGLGGAGGEGMERCRDEAPRRPRQGAQAMTLKDVNDMCPHCADADRATLSALRSVSKANALVVELAEALEGVTPYAESRAEDLAALADPDDAAGIALWKKAKSAVDAATEALAAAKKAGVVG